MSKIDLYRETIQLIARIPRNRFPTDSIEQFIESKFLNAPDEDKVFLGVIFHLRKEIDRQYDEKILKLINELEKAYLGAAEEIHEIEKSECRKALIKAKYEELLPGGSDDICIRIGNLIIEHIKTYSTQRNQEKMAFLSSINSDLMEIFELSERNHNPIIRGKLRQKQLQFGKEMVQALVVEGKLAEALEELYIAAVKRMDQSFTNQVISLQAQLKSLERDKIGGNKEPAELDRRNNQIIQSILQLNEL